MSASPALATIGLATQRRALARRTLRLLELAAFVWCAATLGLAATSSAASFAVTLPEVKTPEVKTPEVSTPEVNVPPVSVPPVTVPPVNVPPVHVPPVTVPPVGAPSPPSTPEAPSSGPTPSAPPAGHPARTASTPSATVPGAGAQPTPAGGRESQGNPGHVGAEIPRKPSARSATGTTHATPALGHSGLAAARRGSGAHAPALARIQRKGSSGAVRAIERLIAAIPTAIWIALAILAALALTLTVTSWAAAARARRIERHRARLAEDVGLLQAALLPAVPERLRGVGTSVAYLPAEGPAAGGDFYDVFERQDGRIAVIVGDVSGHGRAALPHTSLIRHTLRAYLDAGMTPRAALRSGGAVVDHQIQGSFATVVVALYDPRERLLTYACAGHPPPIVIGSGRAEPVLECCSPPLGTGSETGLRETSVRLPGRAKVCLFTDGVVEARLGGDLFGTERLELTLADLPANGTAEALLERVVAHTDRRPDDMAACVLDVPGSRAAPVLCAEELELGREIAEWQGPERFLFAYGADAALIADTLRQLREKTNRDGRAILRLRLDTPMPEAEVASLAVRSRQERLAVLDPSRPAAGGANVTRAYRNHDAL